MAKQSLARSLRRKNKVWEKDPVTGFYNLYKKSNRGRAIFETSVQPPRRIDPFNLTK